MVMIEQLRELRNAEPFRPFDIQLMDGKWLKVDRPEWLAIGPMGTRIVVALKDGTGEIIDVPQVKELKIRTNGRRKRRC